MRDSSPIAKREEERGGGRGRGSMTGGGARHGGGTRSRRTESRPRELSSFVLKVGN